MVTVIALLLGLTVVALQLSSTQFSPRLLRNFLRDRPNQIVLSAFVATFASSAAGLYTVGVSGGSRTAAFPRLAVSGALVLLFVSLGLLVFFAEPSTGPLQPTTTPSQPPTPPTPARPTPSPASPRNRSTADPSSAASSTNTSELRRSPRRVW
jgi:hypothetical protein